MPWSYYDAEGRNAEAPRHDNSVCKRISAAKVAPPSKRCEVIFVRECKTTPRRG